ncbi:hypothetical protein BS17DRAFT_50433 [Gyrodon lividus]|nr:hypothetical protein BS17DRAFT_50433 [Gyrodon lividus]
MLMPAVLPGQTGAPVVTPTSPLIEIRGGLTIVILHLPVWMRCGGTYALCPDIFLFATLARPRANGHQQLHFQLNSRKPFHSCCQTGASRIMQCLSWNRRGSEQLAGHAQQELKEKMISGSGKLNRALQTTYNERPCKRTILHRANVSDAAQSWSGRRSPHRRHSGTCHLGREIPGVDRGRNRARKVQDHPRTPVVRRRRSRQRCHKVGHATWTSLVDSPVRREHVHNRKRLSPHTQASLDFEERRTTVTSHSQRP